MNNDLLTSLRKYKPTDKRDPLENFMTEAFVWLLKNYPDFSEYFLNQISDKLNLQLTLPDDVKWDTQKYFGGVYPDMVCEFGAEAFIFEHKAWSYLHDNQLQNYKDFANVNYTNSYLILITAHEKQHEQDPDLSLCWFDIHKYIDQWLKNRDAEKYFLFISFKTLIEQEGMGPAAPISHASILSYYASRHLKKNTVELTNRIFSKEQETFRKIFSTEINYYLENQKERWGRIGLIVFKKEDWNPGFFIGFLLDGEDHCTKSVYGERSPDFSIMLSFNEIYHQKYIHNKHYQKLVAYLQEEVSKLDDGWDVYLHLTDDSVKDVNKWHPIHVRKPMLEMFKGTSNAEEQEKIFMESSKMILSIITNCEHYHYLKKELSSHGTKI